MTSPTKKISDTIRNELNLLWAAHKNVGLDGYMCLYTNAEQIPFRSKDAGMTFWFGAGDNQTAIDTILEHYNNGRLPNSPMLLNPIIHSKEANGSYKPIGSGIAWCTSLILGIDILADQPAERLEKTGVLSTNFHRGGSDKAGLKAIAFLDTVQKPEADGKTVECCNDLYEIVDVKSDLYSKSYFLSGISYLTNNGLFEQPDIADLFPENIDFTKPAVLDEFVRKNTISNQQVLDANKCWNAYDRIHSLYKKFGADTKNIEKNLRFFNLVARDIDLFDATGPLRMEKNDSTKNLFEFIVPGILPRGSVSLLAGVAGCGKSSLVHQLGVIASSDYKQGEEPAKWLGQPLELEQCNGINIFFSGEDGPQIFNARASIIDPDERSIRLMFRRTDFGENVSFTQYLRHLKKIPDVPLMIVDPSRKYLGGDENDINLVNNFFDALEEFAVEKNTAVLVVHPLQRGKTPKSLSDIIDFLSGSQAFVDRPRIIIGMYRDGHYTVAGLAKNTIPPNIGMLREERVFARDPKNLSLVWLSGKDGIRNAPLSEEELSEIARKAAE
ncbi:MAG: AAA family ATPase [Pseudomonadota bacterium]